MRLREIPRKIQTKLVFHSFRSLRRDSLTRVRLATRPDLEEVGTKYGGWVIPTKLLHEDSVCYCVGCGEDISFDLGLIERFGCEVFAFDPTPRAVEYVRRTAGSNPRYHFSDLGLWDSRDTLKFYAPEKPDEDVSHSLLNLQKTADYVEVEVDRLSGIMRTHGHSSLDLLKMDVEGAEYRVIDSIILDQLDVRVLCVEFDEYHRPIDENYRQRITAAVADILAFGYEMVFTQGGGNYTFVKTPVRPTHAG